MVTKLSALRATIAAQARAAKIAALKIQSAPTERKNRALEFLASNLEGNYQAVLAENALDVERVKRGGARPAFVDRLTLNRGRLLALAQSVRDVAGLPDPVGEITGRFRRPNGLRIVRQRVPIGVIAIIYESRPNVTIDAAVLCLKAGNAVILKGGSDAINSNRVLASLIGKALTQAELPAEAVQFIDTTDRGATSELVKMDQEVDLLIPRGGEEMIRSIREQATVPVLGHGKGLCHAYVDKAANFKMAEEIVINGKCQRPGVCNAVESLIVHQDAVQGFLVKASEKLAKAGVELRGDVRAREAVSGMKAATEEDWDTEYLDLVLAVRVVESMDEAIDHINRYSSHLSEVIITDDRRAAKRFMDSVDSAVVYHNASTRFTDGGEFGFGAEIGIATGKLHARGPMGLRELTSYKYLVYGAGQVRK